LRYKIIDNVLIVSGDFEALSSGVEGGRKPVEHILNIQVPYDFPHDNPGNYVRDTVLSLRLDGSYTALLTAVEMQSTQILTDACVTVFVTAGIRNPSSFGTINIIVVSSKKLSEGAMVGTIITATESKTRALFDMGFRFTGTVTDAVVVACENSSSENEPILYGGSATFFGRRVVKLVRQGVKDALKAHYGSSGVKGGQ
jgi:adenosylcobinamide hydrolase